MKQNKTSTEEQLINSFITEDTKALEILIYRHKEKVFTSIYWVKDKYLVEDVSHDLCNSLQYLN